MKFTVTKPVEIEVSTVYLNLPVRYDEEEIPNDFPFREGDKLAFTVDIDTGRIKDWPQGQEADVHLTVKDGGSYYLRDSAGNDVELLEQEYVPHGLIPGDYGDVILLKIDPSGVITNWPKKPDLSDFFHED